MLYDISINYHERYDGSAIRMVSPEFPEFPICLPSYPSL